MQRVYFNTANFMQPRKSLNFSTALAMSQDLDVSYYVDDLVKSLESSNKEIAHIVEKLNKVKSSKTHNMYFLISDLKDSTEMVMSALGIISLSQCYLKIAENLTCLTEE